MKSHESGNLDIIEFGNWPTCSSAGSPSQFTNLAALLPCIFGEMNLKLHLQHFVMVLILLFNFKKCIIMADLAFFFGLCVSSDII